jgi:hypothetical protein
MSSWALFHDPLSWFGNEPIANSQFQSFDDKGDGLVGLKRADGSYVSQNPNQYGVFSSAPECKAYETFGGGAGVGVKTSWTRPEQGDKIFSYFCCQLPNC